MSQLCKFCTRPLKSRHQAFLRHRPRRFRLRLGQRPCPTFLKPLAGKLHRGVRHLQEERSMLFIFQIESTAIQTMILIRRGVSTKLNSSDTTTESVFDLEFEYAFGSLSTVVTSISALKSSQGSSTGTSSASEADLKSIFNSWQRCAIHCATSSTANNWMKSTKF